MEVVATSGLFSGETSSDIAVEEINTYRDPCWAWKLYLGLFSGELPMILLYRKQTLVVVIAGLGGCG